MIHKNILDIVGNTPLISIKPKSLSGIIDLYAKLEAYNPTGSIKDRPAVYIIQKLLAKKIISKNSLIIESSSGNFGISLAAYCKKYGLKFLCVVDPNISPVNEFLIKKFGGSLIKVNKRDNTGGYLINRIKKIKEILKQNKNAYWINQYENLYNPESYYETLGVEICNAFATIDYVFIGVSSGGTITGVSQRIKQMHPYCKIIAVDIIGSKIFGGLPKKRYIPGMGSSITPGVLRHAHIDEVVKVSELATVKMCHKLLEDHYIFAGGSSGSVFAGILKYFKNKKFTKKQTVVTIFPDKGDRYVSTLYNKAWCNDFIKHINN